MGTRFLFIFFLAKYINPASVGYYGIFTATVGYALYFVGLDFYTYVSREITKASPDQRGRLLKGQAALSGLLYLILLPPGIFILAQANWSKGLIWWFVPILILEHCNQEISRILIALSEQLTASLILFIRQGSWALVIIGLMVLNEQTRKLEVVVGLWALAGFAAASVGFLKLKRLGTKGWHLPVDWNWIKKGIRVSIIFLVATLSLRGVQTFDRYWLEALGGAEMVGAYVLLIGVAGTLLTFLDAALFSFAYPALIQHNHKNEFREARTKVKQLFFHTLILSTLFWIISWLLLPYFLSWIGKNVYQQAMPWYPWLICAMTINAIGLVPHYALYARGIDQPIVQSHLISLIFFILVTWMASGRYSALAVPMGLNAAFAVILIWKAFSYWMLLRNDNAQNLH